jgi:Tn3 transposase DDE domain
LRACYGIGTEMEIENEKIYVDSHDQSDWDLIERQYDEMVKYATALRLGTAEENRGCLRFKYNFSTNLSQWNRPAVYELSAVNGNSLRFKDSATAIEPTLAILVSPLNQPLS